jgi:hypothetical protein
MSSATTILATLLAATTVNESTIGPSYSDAPELRVRDEVPQGVIKSFTMESKDSKKG